MTDKQEEQEEECLCCHFALSKPRGDIPLVVGTAIPQNYFCRRYPPTDSGIIQVAKTGWCGEFAPKEEKV